MFAFRNIVRSLNGGALAPIANASAGSLSAQFANNRVSLLLDGASGDSPDITIPLSYKLGREDYANISNVRLDYEISENAIASLSASIYVSREDFDADTPAYKTAVEIPLTASSIPVSTGVASVEFGLDIDSLSDDNKDEYIYNEKLKIKDGDNVNVVIAVGDNGSAYNLDIFAMNVYDEILT